MTPYYLVPSNSECDCWVNCIREKIVQIIWYMFVGSLKWNDSSWLSEIFLMGNKVDIFILYWVHGNQLHREGLRIYVIPVQGEDENHTGAWIGWQTQPHPAPLPSNLKQPLEVVCYYVHGLMASIVNFQSPTILRALHCFQILRMYGLCLIITPYNCYHFMIDT